MRSHLCDTTAMRRSGRVANQYAKRSARARTFLQHQAFAQRGEGRCAASRARARVVFCRWRRQLQHQAPAAVAAVTAATATAATATAATAATASHRPAARRGIRAARRVVLLVVAEHCVLVPAHAAEVDTRTKLLPCVAYAAPTGAAGWLRRA